MKKSLLVALIFSVINCCADQDRINPFNRLPEDSILRMKCAENSNKDFCGQLNMYLFCSENGPSEAQFKKANERIKQGNATLEDHKVVVAYRQCKKEGKNWCNMTAHDRVNVIYGMTSKHTSEVGPEVVNKETAYFLDLISQIEKKRTEKAKRRKLEKQQLREEKRHNQLMFQEIETFDEEMRQYELLKLKRLAKEKKEANYRKLMFEEIESFDDEMKQYELLKKEAEEKQFKFESEQAYEYNKKPVTLYYYEYGNPKEFAGSFDEVESVITWLNSNQSHVSNQSKPYGPYRIKVSYKEENPNRSEGEAFFEEQVKETRWGVHPKVLENANVLEVFKKYKKEHEEKLEKKLFDEVNKLMQKKEFSEEDQKELEEAITSMQKPQDSK